MVTLFRLILRWICLVPLAFPSTSILVFGLLVASRSLSPLSFLGSPLCPLRILGSRAASLFLCRICIFQGLAWDRSVRFSKFLGNLGCVFLSCHFLWQCRLRKPSDSFPFAHRTLHRSSLKRWACVAQPLRHSSVAVRASWCDETSFLFILGIHPNLMVPRETIQQAHHFTTGGYIH